MSITKAWIPATICIFDSVMLDHKMMDRKLKSAKDANKSKQLNKLLTPENLVSICVTVFNYAHFLTDCLESLKNQTHESLEIVIVDDCSQKDNSVHVARNWAEQNHQRFYRVRVHAHSRNQGPAEARNTAFRLSMGKFIFIIDADNEIYPRAIARLYEAATAGPFDATYCQIEKFGDQRAIGEADIWDIEEMRRNNYVDIMALIRQEIWEKIDGFSHIENGWEDYDFWLKFIDAGFSAAYVPEILCRYRVHGKSRTATEAHAAHEDLRVLMAFRHAGFAIDSASQLDTEPSAKIAVESDLPKLGQISPNAL